MKVVHARCAGLDVHKQVIQVCVRIRAGRKKITTECAQFYTFVDDLERLHEFLRRHKVRRVVIESTGVYWTPVWNVLESKNWKYELVLVNPQHVKALPGRKTDQLDCERLAELGQYDLLRASFIPPPEIRQLRDLTRRRTVLSGDWNRLTNRIRRLLETANVKLGSVMSRITSKTARMILHAIVEGRSNPADLAELAQGSLQQRKQELIRALPKSYSGHFRWLLSELLAEAAQLQERIRNVESRIRQAMEPHADAIRRLMTVPGISEITAWTLVAELGRDMSRFPSAGHCASWAGLCPGNCESAGKRQSGRTRKGNRYLRRILVQNAWAVAHLKQECALTELFYRVSGRKGMKKAAVAVAHRILVVAYCILRDGTTYEGRPVAPAVKERKVARLVRRLAKMGHPVVRAGRADAATAEQCGKCFRWGIPCFHVNPKPLRKRCLNSGAVGG